MIDNLFIGVDVSLKSNQICVMNFNQQVLLNSKFLNTPEGCDDAIQRIKSKVKNILY